MAPRSLLPAIFLALPASVHGFFPPNERRAVDTTYPYKGPKVPVGDWVNNSPNDDGTGFPRLVESPAVTPASETATNNVNVVSLSYVPGGMNVHFQTPFGLGEAPAVRWGSEEGKLDKLVVGSTVTYPRTPSCSEITAITQCSEFYHNVQLTNLTSGTTYYYQILPANGTTISPVLSFTTALAAGSDTPFTVAIMNDMGYTNAQGTYEQLSSAVSNGAAFMWHGGDISYADDWYSGILPCEDSWPVCYNGTSSSLPEGDYPEDYNTPVPEGEIPGQGSPRGGDMSVLYESNWDLWQQWMNPLTTVIPHMVLPGNHEASCAEFDGQGNLMTAYLDEGIINGTAPESSLTYFSCPPSQRNFTAFANRFRMPSEETNGVGNFWYSFDYGLAHFVSLNSETDFAYSPSWPFIRENKGKLGTPAENDTYITDAGPFGNIDDNKYTDNAAFEQVQWLKRDLEKVDREKTPWVFVMGHRPMYSTEVSTYQSDLRDAFEKILLDAGVDVYLSGHVHWYERMLPMGNKVIDEASVINNNTYLTNPGKSMTHIINGMAGNIESHSTRSDDEEIQKYTQFLDTEHYGYNRMTVYNSSVVSFEFIRGDGCGIGDAVTVIKNGSESDPTVKKGKRNLVRAVDTHAPVPIAGSLMTEQHHTSVNVSVPTTSLHTVQHHSKTLNATASIQTMEPIPVFSTGRVLTSGAGGTITGAASTSSTGTVSSPAVRPVISIVTVLISLLLSL